MRNLIVGFSLVIVGWMSLDTALADPVINTTVEVGLGICRHANVTFSKKGCTFCTEAQCTYVACDDKGCTVAVIPAKAPPPGGTPNPTHAPVPSGPEK
jgi:hypothetical protein